MFNTLIQNFTSRFGSPQGIIIWVFVLCISLSFHEMAHAWRAYKLGDDTAQRAGRLTMNPLKHLDPIGTIMMFIAGVGWAKPVPINPNLFTRSKTIKRGIIEVSLAGPLSNLLLSWVSCFLYYLVQTIGLKLNTSSNIVLTIISILIDLFGSLYYVNIILAAFNLLPIPPLDGFKIWGSLLPNRLYYKLMDYERYIGLLFLAIVIFAGAGFSTILKIIAWPFVQIIVVPLDYLARIVQKMI